MTKGEELARQLVDCNTTAMMGSRYYFVPYSLARDVVEALKDCEERKTGKWVLHKNQIDLGWDINCSVCGEGDNGFFARGREDAEYKLKHHYLMDEKRRKGMRYCNYCGAKMEVEE